MPLQQIIHELNIFASFHAVQYRVVANIASGLPRFPNSESLGGRKGQVFPMCRPKFFNHPLEAAVEIITKKSP